ncbi:MAG TPA: DedA family protein [Dissulfurispiraceae bacterium]|nr:DedA family protein [Dissulfurispiraceae bacterium]
MVGTEILENLIRTYGYWALLAGTFIEGETILMLGGLSAQLGYLDIRVVMIVAFIGSFSGDQLYFIIGRLKGMELLAKHPKWNDRVERVHCYLEKYHDLIMLGFRFVYGIRIMTPFVLAMSPKIKTRRFVIFNAIGAAIWSVAVAGGGYLFGHALELLLNDIKRYQVAVMAGAAAIGVGIWLLQRYRSRKKKC